MTTEELYEAFRKKYQDDIRIIPRALMSALDQNAVNAYLDKLKRGKPNLAALTDGELCELMSITRDGVATLSAVLLFGLYPQAYLPQLCITAIAVPGTEIGDLGSAGERFIDNKRIEGSIPQMLYTLETSSCSSRDSSGIIVGIRLAIMLFPLPGGPI